MNQSLIVLALLGVVSARHHLHQYESFAQSEATPASNRAAFEAARAAAAATVATQQKFESVKSADVASRNAANTKGTHDLKAKVRLARQHQIENEVHHDQWVNRNKHSNWAQVSTPADSRKAFESGVASANAVVAKQKAFEAKQTTDITSRHAKQATDTFNKNKASRQARVEQTRGGAKNSRDSKGWRLVWPAGTLAQEETPEESYAAKALSAGAVATTVANQNAEETRRTTEIGQSHSNSAEATSGLKLKIRNSMDNVTRGGVPSARDSLGWSVAQQPSYDHVETMGNQGQIGMVHDFLTADGVNDEMRGFIANRDSDTIGDKKIAVGVHTFVEPILNDGVQTREYQGLSQRKDSIGAVGINADVRNFVEPLIQYHNEAELNGGPQGLVQDTIGGAGYNAKVQAFVRPNIVYQSNDINANTIATNDVAYVGTGEQFLGNPERVEIKDPISYQTRANANNLDGIQIRRTSFYAQE